MLVKDLFHSVVVCDSVVRVAVFKSHFQSEMRYFWWKGDLPVFIWAIQEGCTGQLT